MITQEQAIARLNSQHPHLAEGIQIAFADWFSLFDGLIISCHVQALKPEPAIYQALFDKYGLIPEQSLFIDDSLANIEGGRQLGVAGIHYQTATEFEVELELILGK